MRSSCSRLCALVLVACSLQGTPCRAQYNSGTSFEKIQPEQISLSRSSRPISGIYVGIEPCNLLTAYAPSKTIFHDIAPDSIGSFDTLETTRAVFLTQAVKTAPLGNAKLSEKAIGKDARRYPGWLWKGLIITLSCSIFGLILSIGLNRKKRSDFSTMQLLGIFGPLVPFMLLLLAFGFMSVLRSSVRDPKVDIYVDNATQNTYEILFNRESVLLPPFTHVCLNVRPRDHDRRIREKGSGTAARFAVTAAFREGENYIINMERANRYEVVHKAYTMY